MKFEFPEIEVISLVTEDVAYDTSDIPVEEG